MRMFICFALWAAVMWPVEATITEWQAKINSPLFDLLALITIVVIATVAGVTLYVLTGAKAKEDRQIAEDRRRISERFASR